VIHRIMFDFCIWERLERIKDLFYAKDYDETKLLLLEAEIRIFLAAITENWEEFTWERVYNSGQLSKNSFTILQSHFPGKTWDDYVENYNSKH